MTNRHLILIFVGLLVTQTAEAAYIDPGTGSMILQAVVAGVAAAVLMLRSYWHRVTTFFKSKSGQGTDVTDD